MSVAWLAPGGDICAALGWVSAFLMVLFVQRSAGRPYLSAWLAGIALNVIGFHWLFTTIRDFGGFDTLPALAIFALFAVLSALQFPVFVLLYRLAPPVFELYGLRAATAWVLAECFSVRIFPWFAGHTQTGFLPLAQIADIAGAPLVSFVMFWTAEVAIRIALQNERRIRLTLAPVTLALCLTYGLARMNQYVLPYGQRQEVALLQASISTEDKHNQKLFTLNTDRYQALTKRAAADRRFIIWPEAVIQDWLFDNVGIARRDARLPWRSDIQSPLLIGALTFDSTEKMYNSAAAVYVDGTVPPPYHKQILMPFGEFTPLAGIFPWIRDIHPTPDFEAGKDMQVFDYKLQNSRGETYSLKAAPLICYEDVVPSLSRRAVNKGANVLVSMSNDAWFGDSVAPFQHNLIASFRAIENRRYLLRATNSGLTAIIDPLGRTVASLKPFSEDILNSEVTLMDDQTLYTRFVGENPWWLLLGLYGIGLLSQRRRTRILPELAG